KRLISAIAASEACRNVVPAEVLASSTIRCNMVLPRSVERVDKGDRRPPSPPYSQEVWFPGFSFVRPGDHGRPPHLKLQDQLDPAQIICAKGWPSVSQRLAKCYLRQVTPIRKPSPSAIPTVASGRWVMTSSSVSSMVTAASCAAPSM